MSKFKLVLQTRPIWLLIAAVAIALIVGLMIPTTADFRGPLVDINDGVLIAVITGLGVFVTGLGLFVAQLYQRLGRLEDRIGTIETAKDAALDKLTAAASFINRIGLWLAAGQRGPMPQPPDQILPHIDAELWGDEAIGGSD